MYRRRSRRGEASRLLATTREKTPLTSLLSAQGPDWRGWARRPAVSARTALTWVPACRVLRPAPARSQARRHCSPPPPLRPRPPPPAPAPTPGLRGTACERAPCGGQPGARGPPGPVLPARAQTAFRNLAWRAVSEAPRRRQADPQGH
ncbi:putative uncharacterized protein C1orf229 [Prionailurus viverrinus]|uniref:putative uncharacterized protein C1orf229 n=1 Tax=Prionailurus viverrinus TaxID=61388 RepID=UPI001FF173B7|nr:putative uncharacterized protein C1orf229 [Prionailurus viverrinus]